MLLCIDVGNTNIKLGLFDRDKMRCNWRIATDRANLADEYAVLLINLFLAEGITPKQISGCAISSVVPSLTEVFGELAQRYFKLEPLIVGPDTPTGMKIITDYPAEVGSDLIVNAVAARQLYGSPVIVIGFGTATTFVAVSADGNLEGVAIAPGIATSGESLFRSTSMLPQVALVRPKAALGKNTVNSIRSGFVFGFTGLVEKLVEKFQNELGGRARVIATGGLASLITPETRVIEKVEPYLTLTGLKILYQMNRPASKA